MAGASSVTHEAQRLPLSDPGPGVHWQAPGILAPPPGSLASLRRELPAAALSAPSRFPHCPAPQAGLATVDSAVASATPLSEDVEA